LTTICLRSILILSSHLRLGIEPPGSISQEVVSILNLQERDLLEGLGVDGRTILEWILKKYVSIRGTGLIRLRIGIIGEPL
jgi:hypothetical protein